MRTIMPSFRHLITYICKQCDNKLTRNFTQQQLNDIQNELKRLHCSINYQILNETVPQHIKISQLNCFIDMKMLTNKSGSFTTEDYRRFKDALDKIKFETSLVGYNLIQEQSLSLIDTFKIASDQWFACRNNHVYNIDQVSTIIIENKKITEKKISYFRQIVAYIIINVQHVHKTQHSMTMYF